MYISVIKEQIKEIESIDGKIRRFYCRWSPFDGCICNDRKEASELESVLKQASESKLAFGDWVPIEMLVLYTDECIHLLRNNPLFDAVCADEEEKSDCILYTNVPYVTEDLLVASPKWLKYEIPNK